MSCLGTRSRRLDEQHPYALQLPSVAEYYAVLTENFGVKPFNPLTS